MTNLTITIDEHLLKQARMRALQQGTSVNAVLREYLETYASESREARKATRGLVKLAKSARASSQRSWKREDLHER